MQQPAPKHERLVATSSLDLPVIPSSAGSRVQARPPSLEIGYEKKSYILKKCLKLYKSSGLIRT